jgi:uncharacterized protein YaeQ
MALGATIYRCQVALSDVDRGVYEELDLRLARHPSESGRYLVTRLLGYCLSYAPGIAFSKGGLSSSDEPPIAIHDESGSLKAWIDVGSPSAERLHRAAKAADQVDLFTHTERALLHREAERRTIHRAESIRVYRFDPSFLDRFEGALDRNSSFGLVRNSSELYLTLGGDTFTSELESFGLAADA